MRIRRFLALFSALVVAFSASAQILTCSSNDGKRNWCYGKTANGVRLVRQLSGSPCVQGTSWGYGTVAIWVDHGCRAEFALNTGGGPPQIQPQEAMRSCKNTAGERLPRVPLAYISVYRGSDTGSGSYMINFHAQPPGGPNASGFCIISKAGQLQNFQFDPGSGSPGGNPGNPGGSPMDAMRLCKNAVSARQPNVPLAFIHVDQASVNGGSYSVNFRSLPPNGPKSSGYCDVFKNGRVNVVFDRH
jgi:hypothetical protein